MKIAFFHELHFGGARRVVLDYGKVFAKHHDVSLYYINSKRETDSESIFKTHHFFKFTALEYKGGNWLTKLKKDFIEPIKLYLLHKKIARQIDAEGFDFIFVHPSQFTHAPFLLRFLKTPTIYYCQEPLRTVYDPVVSIPKNISLVKKVYEWVVRQWKRYIDSSNILSADLVLANCNYSRKNIKEAYGIEATTCYLGVDPKLFRPLKLKKEYDLLFVGTDSWMEGYDTFTEINNLFDNKLKIHVVKSDKGTYITDEELVRLYNKSKIVTVLGRFDPFSMLPLEANACGVCPIVVKEGGPIEAVEVNKTGYLLKRDPKLFYELISKLLENNALREQIGRQGRDKVESFWNWEKSTERVFEAIRLSGIVI